MYDTYILFSVHQNEFVWEEENGLLFSMKIRKSELNCFFLNHGSKAIIKYTNKLDTTYPLFY